MATEGNHQEILKHHRRSVWILGTKANRMTAAVKKNYLNLYVIPITNFSKPDLLTICERSEICLDDPRTMSMKFLIRFGVLFKSL